MSRVDFNPFLGQKEYHQHAEAGQTFGPAWARVKSHSSETLTLFLDVQLISAGDSFCQMSS